MAAILMIDDEQAILELVKNGLQKDGHFVTAYTSAAQVPLSWPVYVLIALVILLLIVACVIWKSWRIANENPVNSIKSE